MINDNTPHMDESPIEIVDYVSLPVPPEEGGGVIGNTPSPKFLHISENDSIESINGGEVPEKPAHVPLSGPRGYSTDERDNLLDRVAWLSKAIQKPELRAIGYELCKNDILFWVNMFCYTYNPRKIPSTVPFITYKYEDELILELADRVKNQKDILVDKSRDMGVTWCVLLVFTWYWQFHGEGQDFLVGSRKEQYIDVMGNMDTLIEKVRFLIRNQPSWLRPKGFDWKTHSNYMKIVNPVTKATITGEATNNNFSRGGRRRAIFFDEFAFWECDSAAWRASADSTNCRVVVSTPCGLNNQFAKLRFSGSIDTKSLHWRLHPEKNDDWYKNECKRRNFDTVEIAQELDIDYEGSELGILFPWAELKSAVKNEPIMSAERKVVALDPSAEGDNEAVFYVCNNGNIVERKFIAKTNAMELAAEAVSLINKHKAQVFICDAIGNDVISCATILIGNNPHNCKIVPFKSSEKASDPIKYYNKRAEAYSNAAKQMKSGNVQVDDDHTLMTQLNATKYSTKDGRTILMPKEEIKERVGTSPDRADAWVLAIEGLKFTHSLRELKQADSFRQILIPIRGVASGEEYGNWQDIID